jgi:hypothetical protein
MDIFAPTFVGVTTAATSRNGSSVDHNLQLIAFCAMVGGSWRGVTSGASPSNSLIAIAVMEYPK